MFAIDFFLNFMNDGKLSSYSKAHVEKVNSGTLGKVLVKGIAAVICICSKCVPIGRVFWKLGCQCSDIKKWLGL